jgi:hypothetical protein
MFFVFPQFVPVAGNVGIMNWAIVALTVVFVLAGVCWIVKGREEYLVNTNSILDDNLVVIGVDFVAVRHTFGAEAVHIGV